MVRICGPTNAATEKSSNGAGKVKATLLAGRWICLVGAFVVISTAPDPVVVVSGFGATSYNRGRHKLVHCRVEQP